MTIDASFSLAADGGPDLRTQFGALCWRATRRTSGESEDGIQVLLITSRDTGRWIIPKGWPITGLSPAEAAAREAWEEAGVRGTVGPDCVGIYGYDKLLEGGTRALPCAVAVYTLQVRSLANRFPERKERRRKWFDPLKAARKVAEPELRELLLRTADLVRPLQISQTAGDPRTAGHKVKSTRGKAGDSLSARAGLSAG